MEIDLKTDDLLIVTHKGSFRKLTIYVDKYDDLCIIEKCGKDTKKIEERK